MGGVSVAYRSTLVRPCVVPHNISPKLKTPKVLTICDLFLIIFGLFVYLRSVKWRDYLAPLSRCSRPSIFHNAETCFSRSFQCNCLWVFVSALQFGGFANIEKPDTLSDFCVALTFFKLFVCDCVVGISQSRTPLWVRTKTVNDWSF